MVLRLGVHASIQGGIQHAVERELGWDGNCGQLFVSPPQSWRAPSVDSEDAAAFKQAVVEHDVQPWMIHTSYLVNLCSPNDDLRERSRTAVQQALDAAAKLNVEYVNTHLGAHTGAGVATGLSNAAAAIDDLTVPDGVELLIETDAGGGTKLGATFDELARVQNMTDDPISFCIDTAHIWGAGYEIDSVEGAKDALRAFDEKLGLERLRFFHFNDSKHGCGTNKDEHTHIGLGEIGDSGFRPFIAHAKESRVPVILETPRDDTRSDPDNIAHVRSLARSLSPSDSL